MRFRVRTTPLAIDPKALTIVFGIQEPPENEYLGNVAVVAIDGPLEQKSGRGFDDYASILQRFSEACERPETDTILLRIDSPGGDTAGLFEAVRSMQRLKANYGTTVIAYADECAASAAYAIATVADEIYLPETGGVGSIGVIATLFSQTRRDAKEGLDFELVASGERKTDGHPHEEISDSARATAQKRVNTLAQLFFEQVAEARGIKVADVEALEADVLFGGEAVAAGLADGVVGWDDLLLSHTDPNASVTSQEGEAATPRSDAMNVDELKRRKASALARLKSATTEPAKKRAGKTFREACVALAKAEALVEARRMKKTKYVEETLADDTDSEAEDAEDAEEAEDAEDGADAEGAEDATDAEDAEDEADGKHTVTVEHDDEDDDDDDEDDDDKSSKRMCSELARLTGKRGTGAILGAVTGALEAARQARTEVARMKAREKAGRIDGLLAEARRDGKITATEMGTRKDPGPLREAATRLGTGWLKAHLEQRPALVEREEKNPKELNDLLASGSLSKDQAKIAAQLGLDKEAAERVAKKISATTNGVKR